MTIKIFKDEIFNEEFDIKKYHQKGYKFINCRFNKKADFSEYIYEENLEFESVEFQDLIDFKCTKIKRNIKFKNVRFNKNNKEKIFENARFEGQNLCVKETYNFPRLDGIRIGSCSKVVFRNLEFDKGSYENAKVNYRIARIQSDRIGDYENFSYYYYMERYFGGKIIKLSDYATYSEYITNKFFDILSKYTIGYGEKPWRMIYITILSISVFALFYMFIGVESLNGELIKVDIDKLRLYGINKLFKTYLDMWYFSMITFSTVGYGDMIMTSSLGKVLVCIEVFLGITIAATWASIVIKKMIR